jgi:hypothetical protein
LLAWDQTQYKRVISLHSDVILLDVRILQFRKLDGDRW